MATLQDLREKLGRIEVKKAPVEAPRSETRGAHWVKPELVAEVAFAEFTSEGVVRHASFLGLREDKPAEDIVAETPQPVERAGRSEEHTSELQSLMRNSYAVFCLKKKTNLYDTHKPR